MEKSALKPQGLFRCLYCNAKNPDSEDTCPNTGGRHTLVSNSDKEVSGQGYDEGPEAKKYRDLLQTREDRHRSNKDTSGDTTDKSVNPTRSTATKKTAHGGTGGDDILHCPYCGSGDIWGRSDGVTECNFCNHQFTVVAEPQYSAMPLEMGGQQMDINGNPVDPTQMGADGQPGNQEGNPEDTESGDTEDSDAYGGDQVTDDQGIPASTTASKNPYVTAKYLTANDIPMSKEAYLWYLSEKYLS